MEITHSPIVIAPSACSCGKDRQRPAVTRPAFTALKDSTRWPGVYEQLGQLQVSLLTRSNQYKDAIAASLRWLAFAESRQDKLFQIIFCNFVGAAHMRMLQSRMRWNGIEKGWRRPLIRRTIGNSRSSMAIWVSST